MKKVISCLGALIALVSGHSWVACTKYTHSIAGQDYNNSFCEGYTRDWNSYVQYAGGDVFGVDHGANYQPGTTGQWCQKTIGSPSNSYSSSYTTTYPMASYKPGDTIRLVWPAKNHANYACYTNIPDKQMKLYYNSNANPSSDPSNTPVTSGWSLAFDWHASNNNAGGDGIPFQNCPGFCSNTDKAVCYGDFTVPSLSTGIYTFLWYWAFNSDSDVYTSCWEASISNNASASNFVNSSTTSTTSGSSSNNNQQTTTDYYVNIPICYTGATYNKNTIETAATNYFGMDTSSLEVSQGTNSFNCSLILVSSTASVSNITSKITYTNSSLCTTIQTAFGTGSCDICDDVTVTAKQTTTSSSNQIIINVILLISLLSIQLLL